MSVDFGEKKESARDRLLRIMSDLEWHSWRELVSVGEHRFSSRLRELRRLGYKMEDEEPSEGDGKWYRLLSLERGEPAPKFVRVLYTGGCRRFARSFRVFNDLHSKDRTT